MCTIQELCSLELGRKKNKPNDQNIFKNLRKRYAVWQRLHLFYRSVLVSDALHWKLSRTIPSVSPSWTYKMDGPNMEARRVTIPLTLLWTAGSRKQALDPERLNAGQRPPQCSGWGGWGPQTADRSYCCNRHTPPVGCWYMNSIAN